MDSFNSGSDRQETQEILPGTTYTSQDKLSCEKNPEEARSNRKNGGMGGGTIWIRYHVLTRNKHQVTSFGRFPDGF